MLVANDGVLFNKWEMAECFFGKWQSARWFFGLVLINKVDFYWSGNQRGGKLELWIISEAENVELAENLYIVNKRDFLKKYQPVPNLQNRVYPNALPSALLDVSRL